MYQHYQYGQNTSPFHHEGETEGKIPPSRPQERYAEGRKKADGRGRESAKGGRTGGARGNDNYSGSRNTSEGKNRSAGGKASQNSRSGQNRQKTEGRKTVHKEDFGKKTKSGKKNPILSFIPEGIYNPKTKKVLGFLSSEDLLLIALIFLLLENDECDDPLMIYALAFILISDWIDLSSLEGFLPF